MSSQKSWTWLQTILFPHQHPCRWVGWVTWGTFFTSFFLMFSSLFNPWRKTTLSGSPCIYASKKQGGSIAPGLGMFATSAFSPRLLINTYLTWICVAGSFTFTDSPCLIQGLSGLSCHQSGNRPSTLPFSFCFFPPTFNGFRPLLFICVMTQGFFILCPTWKVFLQFEQCGHLFFRLCVYVLFLQLGFNMPPLLPHVFHLHLKFSNKLFRSWKCLDWFQLNPRENSMFSQCFGSTSQSQFNWVWIVILEHACRDVSIALSSRLASTWGRTNRCSTEGQRPGTMF